MLTFTATIIEWEGDLRARWESCLERWTNAGLIPASTAERILAYEAEQEKGRGLRWPVLTAISFGGLLLCAGVLLLVAAHWDRFSPAQRFGFVLLQVGFFHMAGAMLTERFPVLSSTLHAVGTVCLGAGIFLAGQIFNLQEHWPSGVMLWAFGAVLAWVLLDDWPQAAFAAILAPTWLCSEWMEATRGWDGQDFIMAEGLLMLAISYFTAVVPEKETAARWALAWIGGIALIPLTLDVIYSGVFGSMKKIPLPGSYALLGWTAALLLPLSLAWWLRRKESWMNLIATLWVLILGAVSLPRPPGEENLLHYVWREMGPYGVCLLGSIGWIAWGVKETRKERINLGVAGFALTVLSFYFSSVMDKLGRAASLMGLGVLFLLGGWLLEKGRRRLVARLEQGKA